MTNKNKMVSNEDILKSQVFNIKDVMDLLQGEFENIMGSDPDYYGNFDFILKNEQMYIRASDRKEPNKIYIIVKFLSARINLEQNIVPITITAISERNNIQACQRLLMEFAQTFTLVDGTYTNSKTGERTYYNQSYESPTVLSNFQEIYEGYRSVFSISGEFLISANINASYLYFYPNYVSESNPGEAVYIKPLNNSNSYDASMDSQPYTTTQNFISSKVKYGVNMFTISSFRLNCELHNRALKIKYKVLPIDTPFYFGTKFDNQDELNGDGTPGSGKPFIMPYKLQNAASVTNAGELAVITLVFAQ